MRTFVRRLVPAVVIALASMAAVTIATPAVSSAQCANGEWWDPKSNVCRPPDAPLALPCDAGQWVGPDRRPVPAAGHWAATLGMRCWSVVGPDG